MVKKGWMFIIMLDMRYAYFKVLAMKKKVQI